MVFGLLLKLELGSVRIFTKVKVLIAADQVYDSLEP